MKNKTFHSTLTNELKSNSQYRNFGRKWLRQLSSKMWPKVQMKKEEENLSKHERWPKIRHKL